jgi:hypothetical protein
VVVVVDSVVVVAGAAGVAGASVVVVVVAVVDAAGSEGEQAARARAAAEAATAKVSLNDMEQIPPTDHKTARAIEKIRGRRVNPLRRTKPQDVESLRF